MADQKNPKEASQLFHGILKASVSPKATGAKDKINASVSFKTPGFFGKKDNVLNLSINSKEVSVTSRGGGGYTIYLNNELVSANLLKRDGKWIIEKGHPFTDTELKVIGFEIEKALE